ncbi:2-Methylisocitrate lyase, PEP mutase family [Enhydrobacter aerosaccus]|uniref:2-Methylisocitrate lyase, PEP mutase family n=1 Tax=Enhydrobacter aerosaccus TaxID=225324 RepID=A0A1T4T3A4_9HYPH|nr:isocitrate lyase/PEP mutase family protein [Enhydrobacter aerosaccus]SKA35000.1 2-Methylisocitrate lyase, PEP mutase family [Enhydrobacter aerosaccus]
MTSNATRLKALLSGSDMVIAPGAYDGITARLVDQAGFPAIYMTGAGTAATIGFPDYGLVTMSEMAENAERITRAVKVPVIADADTGYGNELNVVRTVREYERRGVAALHLEDQGFPKKCGHLDDKEIVPREDWLAKIRAAASARVDPDFTIIARTDARARMGFDEAIARANLALAAGADMAFVEAPQTMEEVAAVPKLVKGPCLLNVVWGGKTPDLDLRDVQAMGYRLAIVPGLLFKTVMSACDDVLAALKKNHRHPTPGHHMTVRQAFARVGADDWDPLRTRFRQPSTQAAE